MGEGRVKGYLCRDCGHKEVGVIVFCPNCGSKKLQTADFSSTGRVVAYAIHHVAPEPFVNEAPYAWVIVEVDDGPRLTGYIPFVASPEEVPQRVRLVKSYRKGTVFEKVA